MLVAEKIECSITEIVRRVNMFSQALGQQCLKPRQALRDGTRVSAAASRQHCDTVEEKEDVAPRLMNGSDNSASLTRQMLQRIDELIRTRGIQSRRRFVKP